MLSFKSTLKLYIAFVFLILACEVSYAASGAAEYRGYVSVNRILRERFMLPGSSFELGSYVGQEYDPVSGNLLDLLGTYKTGFGVGHFRNGKPNSLNMLLWHLLLSEFAKDVAKICTGQNTLKFNAQFLDSVQGLCQWPSGNAMNSERLHIFWDRIIKHEAPETEYPLWEKFVTSNQMMHFQKGEAVEWITLSVLMNPYFLLKL